MARFPGREVILHPKHIPVGPGQRIQVGDRRPWGRSVREPVLVEDNSGNLFQAFQAPGLESRDQFFQSQLAFVGADDVDAVLKIEIAPLRGVRASDDHELDTTLLGHLGEPEDVGSRDDVGVETHDPRTDTLERLPEIVKVVESGVKNLDTEAGSLPRTIPATEVNAAGIFQSRPASRANIHNPM